jgi:hypothetical protein
MEPNEIRKAIDELTTEREEKLRYLERANLEFATLAINKPRQKNALRLLKQEIQFYSDRIYTIDILVEIYEKELVRHQ